MEMHELFKIQRQYFASGATLPPEARIDALKRLRSAICARERQISDALRADLGKCETESYMSEIGMTLSEINFMLKRIKGYARDKKVRTPLAQMPARSYIKKSPYGCVLVMSPWNYPFMLSLEPLVDALAAGNTVIVKPSAYSPATGRLISDILAEALPPGLAAAVLGGRAENSALLDMPFDKIFFTGSVAVGREVMSRAAQRLVPVTLELGGKSPCIVDRTADIPLAARRIVFGKFLNCGQTCVAPDYILVHSSVKDALVDCLKREIAKQYGENPLSDPDYGKIISLKHFKRIVGLILPEKVVCGGGADESTLRIEPTVMDGVAPDDAVMGEEIFGPVLPVLAYDDLDRAIAEINGRPHPLALYVFAAKDIARKVMQRCRFGGGCINDTVIHLATPHMGFGGVGESGMGRYHGRAGFDCFTHEQSVVDKSVLVDIPVRYRPYTALKDRLIRLFMR